MRSIACPLISVQMHMHTYLAIAWDESDASDLLLSIMSCTVPASISIITRMQTRTNARRHEFIMNYER